MITLEQASILALQELNKNSSLEDEVVITYIEENENEWTFYYNSRLYVEKGDFLEALFGTNPVIISKQSGKLSRKWHH